MPSRGIELVLLLPKQPDLNGCVGRAQSGWRSEFYASDDLADRIDKLHPLVDAFALRYNHHSPHTQASPVRGHDLFIS
jgi:hypothetical protein